MKLYFSFKFPLNFPLIFLKNFLKFSLNFPLIFLKNFLKFSLNFPLFLFSFKSQNCSSMFEKSLDFLEIPDLSREEDKTSSFFRKNKLFPNEDVSSSFINQIRNRNRDNSVLLRDTSSILEPLKKSLSSNIDQLKPDFFNSPVLKRNNTIDEAKVKFDSFTMIKLLGSGSFGKVFLVRKKGEGELFAMKVLKKRDLIIKKKLRYAITETKILKSCNHPFILQIHYSFQVKNSIFSCFFTFFVFFHIFCIFSHFSYFFIFFVFFHIFFL